MMKNTILISLILMLFAPFHKAQTLKNCSDCATRLIKPEQISELNLEEIRILTNEIYARNGYEFENGRFQEYFESKPWYSNKKNNKSISLNAIEKQNTTLLQSRTKILKAEKDLIINQLKSFKALVLADKTNELKTQFNFTYNPQDGKENSKLLKEVFSKINLDDVNYYKNKGLHSVKVDNGFVQILYEVSLEDQSVNLYYNYMTHSKIIEGFDEFSDYHSETEFMYNWQFELKNKRLEFIRLVIAG
ncbi:YARHG domain-containing protein [Epilithonimonas xixisoli]|nr:YARHG domain-containing protein [Epilithonimonas xixisoli]